MRTAGPTRGRNALGVVVCVSFCLLGTAPALAQPRPLNDAAATPPTAPPSVAPPTGNQAQPGGASAPRAAAVAGPSDGAPRANPSRPTQTDNAFFVAQGWLEFEAGFASVFQSCPGVPTLDGTEPEPVSCPLQRVGLLAKWAVTERQEYRVGWDVFGSQSVPNGDAIRGVGDLYVQGKFGIPLQIEDPNQHRLAVLAEVRPGIGQVPVTVPGLSLGAAAVYSTTLSPVQIDAQAGFQLRSLFEDEIGVMVPLSGAVSWQATSWLGVFGEFVENLNVRDLSNSETQLLVGAAWMPIPPLSVDVSVALGLTQTVPDAILQLGVTYLALPLQATP